MSGGLPLWLCFVPIFPRLVENGAVAFEETSISPLRRVPNYHHRPFDTEAMKCKAATKTIRLRGMGRELYSDFITFL